MIVQYRYTPPGKGSNQEDDKHQPQAVDKTMKYSSTSKEYTEQYLNKRTDDHESSQDKRSHPKCEAYLISDRAS